MKNIIRKTERERKGEEMSDMEEIKVRDTIWDYFVCEKCGVLFSGEDTVLVCKNGRYRCPLIRIKLMGFWKSKCLERIYGGKKESFRDYYKIIENKK